jgi:hypothetical protein
MKTVFRVFAFSIGLVLAFNLGAQVMPLNIYNPQVSLNSANTATVTATLAPGQMSRILISNNAGAATYTLPTATQLCALFPFVNASGGQFWWEWSMINNGTGVVTVAVGAGTTNVGTGTLTTAAGSIRRFIIVLTACGNPTVPGTPAAQLFSLGTSVF